MAWAQSRVPVLDLRMAYRRSGHGDPIVFLHGNPTSSYLWRAVVGSVDHLGRCLAPDLTAELRDQCRTWPAQTEVTVPGTHFLPEDSPRQIGSALADWIGTLP